MDSIKYRGLPAIFEAWKRPPEDFDVIDYGRHLLLKDSDKIVAERVGGQWVPCLIDYFTGERLETT